jgi:hypothetical protein
MPAEIPSSAAVAHEAGTRDIATRVTAALTNMMKSLITFLLICVLAAGADAQTIYIDTRLPNAHPTKTELVAKLQKSGKVTLVNLPDQADLILILDQTERLWSGGGNGNRGRVILKDRRTGEEMWSEEKGGGWQMSGWSAGSVGRKLGDDLLKFLKQRNHSEQASRPY